ncbi:hypothetical protein D3C81_439440 [compost metagenome]
MGNQLTVFRYGQQLFTPPQTVFRLRHVARQLGKAQDMRAQRFQGQIDCLQELLLMQLFPVGKPDTTATFIDLLAQPVEAFFQQ